MARMLQALKNLEARGQRAASAAALISESISTPSLPADIPSEAAVSQESPANSDVPSAATQVVTTIDFAASQLASLGVVVEDSFLPIGGWQTGGAERDSSLAAVVAEVQRPEREYSTAFASEQQDDERLKVEFQPPQLEESVSPLSARADYLQTVLLSRQVDEPLSERAKTAIERAAARTLNNPLAARPIVDLSDRLEAEAKQSGSHTVVLVGVGAGLGTAEALVLAGTLLAERRQRALLLVDADIARRELTTALASLGKAGFADTLVTDDRPEDHVATLATPNLMLLAAGRGADIDVAQAEARLEAMLKALGERFGLVLIDGGQAGSELAAALARQADATYLVVELGIVEASEAQAALRDLRAAGGRVLGCIAT